VAFCGFVAKKIEDAVIDRWLIVFSGQALVRQENAATHGGLSDF